MNTKERLKSRNAFEAYIKNSNMDYSLDKNELGFYASTETLRVFNVFMFGYISGINS